MLFCPVLWAGCIYSIEYTGQRDGSCPRQGRMAQDFTMLLRMICDLKLNELFISGIFHLVFLDYS